MTHRLPDGGNWIQLLLDNAPGEAVTFASEAEAQAVADRLGSMPDVEFRAAPLAAIGGELLAIDEEDEELRQS